MAEREGGLETGVAQGASSSPSRQLAFADIAWAAGLFEGEGSLSVTKKGGRNHGVRLTLKMTDRDVVERFHAIVGVGQMHRLTFPKTPHWKPAFVWDVGNNLGVRAVIQMLWDQLGERRKKRAADLLRHLETPPLVRSSQVRGQGTQCKRGHSRTEPHIGYQIGRDGGRRYQCKTCKHERDREARWVAMAGGC